MDKMTHVISVIVIAFVLLFAGTGMAAAIPPAPEYGVYRGDVFVNGTLAADGTVVSVKVGALDEVNDSTENGWYGIAIEVTEAKHGDTVILKIYDAVVDTTTLDKKGSPVHYNDINLYLEDRLVNESAQPDTLPETTNESHVLINWASHPGYDSTGIKCYELLRKYEDEETFSIINKTSDTSYLDTVTTLGKYYYRIITYDFVGNSKNCTHDVNTAFVSSETYTVSGYVKYENETGIGNVNVTLVKGSSIINSTTTAGDGYYELNASWGKYNLNASKGDVLMGDKYISFIENVTSVTVIANMTINLTLAIKGDLNGDCKVDMEDVNKIAGMIIGSISEDLRADFNENGRVDVGDAAKLFGYVKGGVDKL
jgi:hypothetical protein